jgi:hypothetical protein
VEELLAMELKLMDHYGDGDIVTMEQEGRIEQHGHHQPKLRALITELLILVYVHQETKMVGHLELMERCGHGGEIKMEH